MVGEAEYNAAIEQITSYADDLNLNLDEEVVDEDDNGRKIRHLIINDSEQVIYISARIDTKYFIITYTYSIRHSIAQRIKSDDAKEILANTESVPDVNSSDEGSDENVRLQAATKLLREVDSATVTELKRRLYLIATGTDAGLRIDSSEKAPFAKFDLSYYLFPYEQDFCFRRFAEKVRKIRGHGHKSSQHMMQSVRIQTPDDSDVNEYRLKVTI